MRQAFIGKLVAYIALMNILPPRDPQPGLLPDDTGRDAARISAEIASAGHGTDPFAEAVRATRMPMVISDPRLPDNPVVFVNDAFCRLTGYERQEIIGRNCRFLQGPETDPAVVRRIRDAVNAAQPIQVDIRNHRKSGEAFWNRLLMAPVYGADGKLAYFFASQVDVTIERERLAGLETHNAALMAEVAGRLRAQQESEARLRFATQAGGLGIWELDLRNWTLNASGLFKRIFGRDPNAPFSHEEMVAAIHPDDRDRVLAAKRHAAATGTEYNCEYRVIRPDHEIGWVQVRAQVVRSIDGSALRMAGICLDTTERRNAEIKLELSEESLRLAAAAAELGTWDYNPATDALTWTERTREMFGIAPGRNLHLRDYFDAVHPDDLPVTREVLAATLDPEIRAPLEFEYRVIRRDDGAVRWISAKGNGVFEDGSCVRALGTCIDITEKRLAEERQAFLLGLWDRLRTLSEPRDIMDVAVMALGRHLRVSRVGYGLVEADDATVSLQSSYADGVERLIGAYRLDGFGPHYIAAQRQGRTVVQENVAADPRTDPSIWQNVQTSAFVSVPLIRGGRLAASLFVNNQTPRPWSADEVALIQDVAARTWDAVERARAEAALRAANEGLERQVAERTAALRASEARLRTIFETSFQFQGLIALDGTLLDANATALAAIESERDAVVGQKFWDTPWFSQTPGASAVVEEAVSVVAQGGSFRQEFFVDLASGPRSFDFSLRPVQDGDSDVTAIVPEAVETTERRRTEEALRQAQKMEAVGQLTGGIAHDFNNLLAGIMGSLELLQRRIGAGRIDGVDRYTAAAMTSAQRASALTQRLLAFARRQPLDPKIVDANRLVAGMEDLLRRTLGPAIALEMVLAGGLWTTMSDPNQLESAILNLAINARDAMQPSGGESGQEGLGHGGRLTIETANTYLDDAYARAQGDEVRPGQYVQISVTDTGTGMAQDIIEKAFDPFFTTKPTGQGTGLGLSMVYGFVKQSEGHVKIYSELHDGTTFKIYLPRHRGGAATEAGDPTEIQPAAPRAEAGETVLVVDDEATVRMLVTETLEDLGYAAIEANDGPSGLAILQSDARIDLLITDVGLPGLNGRQLADAARQKRPNLKILFMTGYAHNAAIGNGAALANGMEIMTKPFALADLAKKIRDMIEAV
jgi:PAS domain S-box-containing protein